MNQLPKPTGAVSRRGFIGLTGLGIAGLAGAGAALAISPSRNPDELSGAAAHAWVQSVYQAVWATGNTPPAAARIYAYVAVAMYESVVPEAGLRTLAGQLNGLRPLPPAPAGRTDPPCVLSGALRVVLERLFPSAIGQTRRALFAGTFQNQIEQRRLAGVPAGTIYASLDHGERIGREIAAWVATDGYAGIIGRSYHPPEGDQYWRPSPPLYGDAVEPYFDEVRTMVLRTPDEVAPVAPVPYSPTEGSLFWEQARATYEAGIGITQEQREIAMFWRDNPRSSGLPAGHWMQIARQVCEQQQVSLTASVEAYALTAIALHDAFINCWTWKYRYNLIRPVDYVHQFIDPTWTTWVDSPQFPEYTSGHSVGSAAAATTLTDLFGDVAFSDTNTVPEWGTRQFGSFTAAAGEAAQSRLFGGIHYPMAIEFGLDQGERLAGLVITRLRTR